MSQTIELSARVRLKDLDASLDNLFLLIPQQLLTRTTAILQSGVQACTTTEAALALGNVTTTGLAIFKNLDASNDIEVGFTVGGSFYGAHEIPAGCWCIAWLDPDRTWQAKADTSTSNLQYTIFQRNA